MLSSKELTAEKYISKHHIDIYFEDAVKQMLICKSDNLKIKPDSFLHQYFLSLKHGTHTLYREYEFVCATPWNRASFVKTLCLSFHRFHSSGHLLRIEDYLSLICLLCPDFNNEIVQKTAKLVLLEQESVAEGRISFTDFIYAFQFQFYYNEFIEKCDELFQTCINPTADSTEEQNRVVDVKASDFLQAIRTDIYNKNVDFALPPEDVIVNTIRNNTRVKLVTFLMQLARCKDISESIGGLSETLLAEGHISF